MKPSALASHAYPPVHMGTISRQPSSSIDLFMQGEAASMRPGLHHMPLCTSSIWMLGLEDTLSLQNLEVITKEAFLNELFNNSPKSIPLNHEKAELALVGERPYLEK